MSRKERVHLVDGSPPEGTDNTIRVLTKQEFGKRVYKLMLEKGWRQADLHRAAGLPKDSISSYIRGRTFPTQLSAIKLAKALGVPVEEIMPNHMAGAIADDEPEFDLKVSVSDPKRAWLRVNRSVPFEVGVRIAALLQDDASHRG
jgi:transcriptional regulator with XRE-family HTH domain